MRFDDMLATVLAREPERQSARIALWRQLLDLLAQHRGGEDRDVARAAFDRLVGLRAEVPVATRRAAAAAIAGRPVSPVMVALIAGDVPLVAGAMLSQVRLDQNEWLTLLPCLSPTARGFLRHRRDLGPRIEAALAGFGASDMVLGGGGGDGGDDGGAATGDEAPIIGAADPIAPRRPAPAYVALVRDAADDDTIEDEDRDDEPELPLVDTAGAPFEPGAGEGQIRAIISRIARFRSNRDDPVSREPRAVADPAPVDSFLFETGVDGTIRWVEGVPRGPLIGETIATPALGAFGVDAQAPGAFRRRAPFRDARLLVAGAGPAAGEWRIGAVPVFAPATGRFLGYRGTARRPQAHERAEPAAATPGDPASADSLRQLVHELRTPLNAIGGFAEMIRRQMRGPVAEAYRDRAERIADQAGQLLTAVDDLDVSARLDSARIDLQRLAVDVAPLLTPVCAELGASAHARGSTLDISLAPALPAVIGDAAAIRRMVSRLLAAATGLAVRGETVRLVLDRPIAGQLSVQVTRPTRLIGVAEASLFDPGYDLDGDWPDAPLLGLGFSLHLVRRLAVAAGGQLLVQPEWFALRLPTAEETPDVGSG